MAIVVQHKESNIKYFMLGAGFGATHAINGHFLFGNLAPKETAGAHPMVAVSTWRGDIEWFHSDELQVLSVDGEKTNALVEPRERSPE